MSIITIKDSKKNDTEFNMQNITQLQGENIKKKEYIISSITKHFSNHRYCEHEEFQYNNVLLNGKEVGRKYFSMNYISDIHDIERELNVSKNSLITNYMNSMISDISISRNMNYLNDDLQRIVNDFNDRISIKSLTCKLKTIEIDLDKLLKNNLEIEIQDDSTSYLEYISNYDKVSLYIELLCNINQIHPDKRLIIFDNIDNLITENQYDELIETVRAICQNNDFHFIFICSKQNYLCIDEKLIAGINIINDVIFNVSSLDLIKNYVENHYPYNAKFEMDELIGFLKPIINRVGRRNSPLHFQSQIILNLLNADLSIIDAKIQPVNKIEIEYMTNQ